MSVELLYTSAAQGLKQGSRGFCTVLSTIGMPLNLATRLESLSAYRHVFPPNHPDAAKNPVSFSHLRITIGGRPLSILSRISDYGVDYSQRSNKLAHHVVLEGADLVPAGPAWVMSQPSIMRSHWDGQCATPATGPTVPPINQSPRVCLRWSGQCSDTGWGGVVAEALAQPPGKPLWIIFTLAQSSELLALINESIALLPVEQRWQATFSTYATNLPPDADCKVRCVLAGTDDARLAPARGKVIDISKPLPPIAPTAVTPYVLAARNGTTLPGISSTAPLPSRSKPTQLPKLPGGSVPEISGELFDVDEADLTAASRQTLRSKPTSELRLSRSASAPPAVKTKPLAPHSAATTNSKLKWAFIGVSIAASLLLIVTFALLLLNNSVDVAQKSNTATDEMGKQNEAEKHAETKKDEIDVTPAEPKPEANTAQSEGGKTEDGTQTVPPPDLSAPPHDPNVPKTAENPTETKADIQQPKPNTNEPAKTHEDNLNTSDEKQQATKSSDILVGEINAKKLLDGSVLVKIVVPIPAQFEFKKSRYVFHPDGAPRDFQSSIQLEKRSNIKMLKPIGEPFMLEADLDPKDKDLGDRAKTINETWKELGAKLTEWQSWFKTNAPDQVLQMKLERPAEPEPNEPLKEFIESLDAFEKDVSEIDNKVSEKKQRYAERRTKEQAEKTFQVLEDQLKKIAELVEKLKRDLNAICEIDRKFETGTILYIGSADKIVSGKLVDPVPLSATFAISKDN